MHVEVSIALNFVISYLYNKLPRRRVNHFGEELERGLKRKFEGHWYTDKPFKGSAFRCIRVSGEGMDLDPVIETSANVSGLNMDEVKEYLPRDLTIWIDPSEVSYKIGEKGAVKILYSDKRPEVEENLDTNNEIQNANKGFNPEAQSFRPIDSLSSSLTNLSLSPSPNGWGSTSPTQPAPGTTSTSPVTPFLNRHSHATTFTAADFAQTKFGSTKLKTQAKRPSRLSPTEFGAYVKQRSTFQLPSPVGPPGLVAGSPFYSGVGAGSPILPAGSGPVAFQHGASRHCSLSPRDVRDTRQDFLEQQRLLFLQHQQQQQASLQQHDALILGNGNLLSPMDGPMNDLFHISPQSETLYEPVLPDLQLSTSTSLQDTPSPTDPNKTFLDTLNWNTLPSYASLQHLLVAN